MARAQPRGPRAIPNDEQAPRGGGDRPRGDLGAKLRSFMTVLGNIVAVTSIIAVVSLIQGLNASVTQAILSQAGADSFSIQRYPVTRSDEEFDEVRSNPIVTLTDAVAIERYGEHDRVRHGRGDRPTDASPIATARSTARACHGVTSDYVDFSTFDAERGRLISPIEVEHRSPLAVIGSQTADRLFGADDRPDRQDDPDRGRALPDCRRQREEGHAARPVAGRVRGHAARPVPDDLRLAPVAVPHRQAARRHADLTGDGRSDAGAAERARPEAEAAGQLRHVHVRHDPRHLPHRPPTASSPCSSASSACRSWSAASSS